MKEEGTKEGTLAQCLGRSQSLTGKHDEIGEALQTSKIACGKQRYKESCSVVIWKLQGTVFE